MRVDAISSDTSRAAAIAASRPAPSQARPAQQAPKPAAPKDADGDSDGDTGTKGGLLDIGA